MGHISLVEIIFPLPRFPREGSTVGFEQFIGIPIFILWSFLIQNFLVFLVELENVLQLSPFLRFTGNETSAFSQGIKISRIYSFVGHWCEYSLEHRVLLFLVIDCHELMPVEGCMAREYFFGLLVYFIFLKNAGFLVFHNMDHVIQFLQPRIDIYLHLPF